MKKNFNKKDFKKILTRKYVIILIEVNIVRHTQKKVMSRRNKMKTKNKITKIKIIMENKRKEEKV